MTPYPELIWTLNNLPFLIRDARKLRGISLQRAAKQIGVSASTLCLVEAGGARTMNVAVRILYWLDDGDDE